MKISIIIPTYKPDYYIRECLKSLKEQTLTSDMFEIIIILNGCNEPYYTFISNIINHDMEGYNIRLIQLNKAGVSNARNIGINNSIGEYLCFIDDDDIVSSNYLEELLSVSSKECIGCANSYSFTENTNKIFKNFLSRKFLKCKDKSYTQFSYRGHLSPPVSKLIHRNIIGNIRFKTNLLYSEDSVFCFELVPYINKMKLTSDSCIYYIRNRKNSATRIKISIKKYFPQYLRALGYYILFYFRNPLKYEFLFFISRLVAANIHLIRIIKNNITRKYK